MSEDTNNEPVVSEKDIADIEKSLLSKEKARMETDKKEIKEELRKEFESEQKFKNLEEENKKFQEIIRKQAEEKKSITDSKNEEVKKLQEEIGSSKALRPSDSPFGKPEVQTEPKGNFVKDLSEDDMVSVDDESLNAFLEQHGLTKRQWNNK